MKAISLIQPWAELVVIGAKKYETRAWQTFHRGRILIHASKGQDEAIRLISEDHFKTFISGKLHLLTFGGIIGECKIEGCYPTENVRDKLSDQEKAFGDYSTGRWAWKLTDPIKYKAPIQYRGLPGLWDFPDEQLLNDKMMNR